VLSLFLRLRTVPIWCDSAFLLFLPHLEVDLPHLANSDALRFSARRTVDNLALFLGPPRHDAIGMEFVVACCLATWASRLDG